MKTKTKSNKRELQRAAVMAAMPDVKALVKKHGRSAVTVCLNKLRIHDREAARLRDLKAEVAALERNL